MQNPKRLNYIGSKFLLLEWLETQILSKTGWTTFRGHSVADLFGGTGIVSAFFRSKGATVISNDAELYSHIITSAFTTGRYTDRVRDMISLLNKELEDGLYKDRALGQIAKLYSPAAGGERKFFTEDNAKRIDYLRQRIQEISAVSDTERNFLLATLLLAADAVSNVPAVYGCFLKDYKTKATKPLVLCAVHTDPFPPANGSRTMRGDVLEEPICSTQADIVYLDPPYNGRQYSKNYFPLNVIAKTPEEQAAMPPLKGKTGIPQDCFLSAFCRKEAEVLGAFKKLVESLQASWVFISYSSDSTVNKESMVKMLEELECVEEVSVVERDQKRFKSYEYNEQKVIKEYLFCVRRRG